LCLDTLAWIAAGEHDPRRAATLLGAAAALSQAMGTLTVTYPDLAGYHEQSSGRPAAEGGRSRWPSAMAAT
jgi:non-specific serine/threonine protein kinase